MLLIYGMFCIDLLRKWMQISWWSVISLNVAFPFAYVRRRAMQILEPWKTTTTSMWSSAVMMMIMLTLSKSNNHLGTKSQTVGLFAQSWGNSREILTIWIFVGHRSRFLFDVIFFLQNSSANLHIITRSILRDKLSNIQQQNMTWKWATSMKVLQSEMSALFTVMFFKAMPYFTRAFYERHEKLLPSRNTWTWRGFIFWKKIQGGHLCSPSQNQQLLMQRRTTKSKCK